MNLTKGNSIHQVKPKIEIPPPILQRALAKVNNSIRVHIALAGGYSETGRQERCVAAVRRPRNPSDRGGGWWQLVPKLMGVVVRYQLMSG